MNPVTGVDGVGKYIIFLAIAIIAFIVIKKVSKKEN